MSGDPSTIARRGSRARFAFALAAALFVLILSAGAVMASSTELEQMLSAAQSAYETGEYETAANFYEAARASGLEHSQVHYNLGNAYFKQGALGRAIGSYVRAQRLAPRDPRIATNLERARAQIRDRELDAGELPAVLRPVPWLYGRLSLDEWWILALGCWVLLAGSRVVLHWSGRGRQVLRRAAFVLGCLTLLATLMGTIRYRNEIMRTSAVAVVEEIEVRSGPGRDYSLAFRIHEGLQVRMAERRDQWVRIELGGDLTGWVPVSSLEIL